MTYKEKIIQQMSRLAEDKRTIFIGYNVGRRFGCAGGTLVEVSDSQLIEMPVAENLMAGVALGMAMEGWRPVVYFERFDFIFNALDCIVNHIDKISKLSDGQYKAPVLFRCVVGNKKIPLFTGITHNSDYKSAMNQLVDFMVFDQTQYKQSIDHYIDGEKPVMVVEYKDYYNANCK